jgi:hypothetical protein
MSTAWVVVVTEGDRRECHTVPLRFGDPRGKDLVPTDCGRKIAPNAHDTFVYLDAAVGAGQPRPSDRGLCVTCAEHPDGVWLWGCPPGIPGQP